MQPTPSSNEESKPVSLPPINVPAKALTMRWQWPRLWEQSLAFALGICVVIMAQSLWKLMKAPAPLIQTAGSIDLNYADAGILKQLPGVGPQLADRIVDHRTRHGPFGRIEDLQSVQGIGPATLERLKHFVVVTGMTTPAPQREMQPLRSGPKVAPSNRIDLNLATVQELMTLPGIGPALADRIIDDRQNRGPFQSVNDLCRIRGIKAKTIEKLAPFVHVKNAEPGA